MSNASSMKSLKASPRCRPRDRVSEITEIDEEVAKSAALALGELGQISPLQSALENMEASEALQTTQRLRVRLGAITASSRGAINTVMKQNDIIYIRLYVIYVI